jgi:serine/threonine protein kinase
MIVGDMGCLSENTVLQVVQAQLPADERAAVEAHLDTCPSCLRTVAEAAKYVFQDGSQGNTVVRQSSLALLEPGAQVGRYVITGVLGEGGMGVVYAAHDPQLERDVALKLVRASSSSDHSKARLLREAKAMARLGHPNVITVHDAGEHDGRVFIAMELVTGGRTLDTWLAEEPRPWRAVLDMLLASGRGLAAAHAAGIVHRDFKPQNVLIGRDGRPRVSDFGLARSPDDAAEDANAPDAPRWTTGLTIAGAVIGTPAYMAPEQFRGEPADARSDQFSFCVALYQALYGEKPFGGDSITQISEQVLAGQLQPRPKTSDVPEMVYAVLLRGLASEREGRFASLDVLLGELERAAARPRRRRLVFAAAPVVAIGMAIGALALAHSAADDAPPAAAATTADAPVAPAAHPAAIEAAPPAAAATPVPSPPSPPPATDPPRAPEVLPTPRSGQRAIVHRVPRKQTEQRGSAAVVGDAPLDPWHVKR